MSNLWSISDNSCKTSRRMKRILLSLMVFMVLAASASAQRLRERLRVGDGTSGMGERSSEKRMASWVIPMTWRTSFFSMPIS